MFYTYILKSLKDDKFYTGWTDNLKERLARHKTGSVLSTKDRLPIRLIYYEACLNKGKAVAREKYLKSGFGRNFLKHRL